MYNVYQHWDPLKVCIVGKTYPPEFYSYITNSRARSVMEKIAQETEEDFQKLITLLESFGVKVLRPVISDNINLYRINGSGALKVPPMNPRDYMIMLGNEFFFKAHSLSRLPQIKNYWNHWRGPQWPENCPETLTELKQLPQFIKNEIRHFADIDLDNFTGDAEYSFNLTDPIDKFTWGKVLDNISSQGNPIYNCVPWFLDDFNSATSTRIGKDIYRGTIYLKEDLSGTMDALRASRPEYRWHSVDTGGHADGTFCAVKPGLIISLKDVPTYKDTFPGWEVVYLPGESYAKMWDFQKLKAKNGGKWWVPGEELNDEFTDFVESELSHWVGYVEESVFDVNMLVIDEKNVVINNYNEKVIDAFKRHGITPHFVNHRHRHFWDSGLHCITADLHREGVMKDYFTERG